MNWGACLPYFGISPRGPSRDTARRRQRPWVPHMNKPAKSLRWYQAWRHGDAPAKPDPADFGTCFGLEISLAADPAPAKAVPARRLGWMQRFAAKRRAAV